MEIIAVVTIIMILAGAGVLITTGIIEQQKEKRAKVDCETIAKAAMLYEQSWGQVPGLDALVQRQPDNSPALLPPEAVYDPWRQPYVMDGSRHPTTNVPRIYSNGPPGTGKVIANWQ
jgi:hypothetical protein